jgi:hypothetical protein
MDTVELKKLLIKSKAEPVKCAVGVGKDGTAQIILHKIKAGMALVKELESESGKIDKVAFGTAVVDSDTDAKMVILTLNKVGGGGAIKLKKALKGTGFTKVEIRLEDGSVAESAAEEEESEEQAQPPTTATAPVAPPAPPPPQPEAKATQAALQSAMPALIKQVQDAMAANPASAAKLKPLATAALTAVKGQDVDAATQAIAALKAELGEAAPPGGASAAQPQETAAPQPAIKAIQAEFTKLVPTFAAAAAGDKARMDTLRALAGEVAAALKANDAANAAKGLDTIKQTLAAAAGQGGAGKPALIEIWRDAKDAVDGRITALQKACLNHPSDALRALLKEVADKGLNGVTDRASVGMIAAMMEAERTPETRTKAQKAVDQMRAFLKTPEAANVDENPFDIKVDLAGTLGAALDKIEARLAA